MPATKEKIEETEQTPPATPEPTDQPASEPESSEADLPETPGADETPEETEKPAKLPLLDRLGQMDDDDWKALLELDHVKGRVGQIADRRARELKRAEDEQAKREQERDAQRKEEERLRRLRKTDLEAYNAEMDAREAAEEFQHKEAARTRALAESFVEKLDGYVSNKFAAEVKSKFEGKSYENEGFIDGVIHYVDDLIDTERTQLRKEIEKELRPAIRKQILTELNRGESPEPANGGRGKTKAPQEFQSEQEVAEAFVRGDISKGEMTAWYKSHQYRR